MPSIAFRRRFTPREAATNEPAHETSIPLDGEANDIVFRSGPVFDCVVDGFAHRKNEIVAEATPKRRRSEHSAQSYSYARCIEGCASYRRIVPGNQP